MGEMIDAVAHQWKQPLNAISMMIDMLKDDYRTDDVNEEYIEDLDETIHLQIDHMVNTLNEFKHLFINLINNSIDAYNEHEIVSREIIMRCYKENKKIYIEVEDNAGGISKNIINHIFKPNVTTKAEGKGTGIGLYMSSQIVTKNHGSINVHNTDNGAFFTIIIPEGVI